MADAGGDDQGKGLELLGIPAAARKSFEAREEEVEVFAENWPAFQVFRSMRTQWRVGMGGAAGLVYEALPMVSRACGVARAEQADVFEAVQVMELETLAVWREQDERKRADG